MQYVLLSMIVGALFGGGMAIAQSSTEPSTPHQKPRYAAKFDERFKAADADGDGVLTKSEAESAKLVRLVDHFTQLDANQDGKLTREEIRNAMRSRISS